MENLSLIQNHKLQALRLSQNKWDHILLLEQKVIKETKDYKKWQNHSFWALNRGIRQN